MSYCQVSFFQILINLLDWFLKGSYKNRPWSIIHQLATTSDMQPTYRLPNAFHMGDRVSRSHLGIDTQQVQWVWNKFKGSVHNFRTKGGPCSLRSAELPPPCWRQCQQTCLNHPSLYGPRRVVIPPRVLSKGRGHKEGHKDGLRNVFFWIRVCYQLLGLFLNAPYIYISAFQIII